MDPFSNLGDEPLLLSGEQLVSGLAFWSDAALAPSPAIGPSATLKPLSGSNIVPPFTPAEQTTFVFLLSFNLSMTSLLSTQEIPAPSTLSSVAVVELLVPSPAISPLASLKLLSCPNIIPSPRPIKETASLLLPLSSPLIMSPILSQGIPAPCTLLFGAVVRPSFPSIIQSTPLTSLLDPAVESPTQGKN